MTNQSVEQGAAAERTITVALLDDQEIVLQGLNDLLQEAGIAVVGAFDRIDDATRHIPALHPDVAILDVRLPDGSGIEVCRAIHTVAPEIAVLMLTAYDDDDEALFASIVAGASGYLLKRVRGYEIVGAVQHLAAGRSLLDPTVTARVMARLRAVKAQRLTGASLTPEEQAV